MDALALLCTLHADGPTTLKRLRQAGCTTLEALAALEPERAASLLDDTPAMARRLQREARTLRERLTGELERAEEAVPFLPRELAPEAPPFAHGDAAPSNGAHAERAHANGAYGDGAHAGAAHSSASYSSTSHAPRESRSAADPGESLATPRLEAREQRIVQRVIETWRLRDAEEDSAPAAALPARPAEIARTEYETPLRPGSIDGLEPALTARFAEAGIGTLEALARAEPVELLGRVPIGFSRLNRLVALARRASSSRSTVPQDAGPRVLPLDRISRSTGASAAPAPAIAPDLPDALKNAPLHAPKDRPTRFEAEREGAGGPFT
jgi:hypothetical protein